MTAGPAAPATRASSPGGAAAPSPTSADGRARDLRRGLQATEVRVDHHLHEVAERVPGLPGELALRLRRVADQLIDLGRAQELRVGLHVLLPVEADVGERDLCELTD